MIKRVHLIVVTQDKPASLVFITNIGLGLPRLKSAAFRIGTSSFMVWSVPPLCRWASILFLSLALLAFRVYLKAHSTIGLITFQGLLAL